MSFETWQSGDVTLYRGDCLEVMPTLGDKSIDMIFTDPPYGHTENGSLSQRREATLGWQDGVGVYRDDQHHSRMIANDGREANDLFRRCVEEYARLLPFGACCCCCGGGGGPDPQFARWSLWLEDGLDFKQMVVWDKGPMGMGWHYRRSYETVLVAMRPGAACRWYDTTDRVENVIRPTSGIRKIIPSADQHPTEKPVSLADHFIRLHSTASMIVLDPFMDSGTTGVAAVKLGRKFIGIEIEPKYFEIAKRRIQQAQAEDAFLTPKLIQSTFDKE